MKEPTGGRLINLFGDLFDRFVAPGLRPSIYTATWASTLEFIAQTQLAPWTCHRVNSGKMRSG